MSRASRYWATRSNRMLQYIDHVCCIEILSNMGKHDQTVLFANLPSGTKHTRLLSNENNANLFTKDRFKRVPAEIMVEGRKSKQGVRQTRCKFVHLFLNRRFGQHVVQPCDIRTMDLLEAKGLQTSVPWEADPNFLQRGRINSLPS